jgi:hypothetical protein
VLTMPFILLVHRPNLAENDVSLSG